MVAHSDRTTLAMSRQPPSRSAHPRFQGTVPPEEAEATAHAQIEQGDRKRATNYQYYTREIWGHAKNFHLAIDTTFGDDYALDMILSALHALQNSQQLEQV